MTPVHKQSLEWWHFFLHGIDRRWVIISLATLSSRTLILFFCAVPFIDRGNCSLFPPHFGVDFSILQAQIGANAEESLV